MPIICRQFNPTSVAVLCLFELGALVPRGSRRQFARITMLARELSLGVDYT